MKDPLRSLSVRLLSTGVLLLVLLASGAARTARASSIVPPRDLGELGQLSDAVVLARAGAGTPFARGGLIRTRTRFEVLDVVRGAVPGQLMVETYGGVVDGIGWTVAGSPDFAEGRVYLLFLTRRGEAWQPRMLAYGLLEQVVAPDGSVMLTHVRALHDLELLQRPDGTPAEPVETYYQAPLLQHLRRVVRQHAVWERARVVVPEARRPFLHDGASKAATTIPEPCVYMEHGGYPIRWDAFDAGQTVHFYAEAGGDVDVPGDGEFDAVQEGIDAWTGISGVDLDYHWAGADAYTPDCSDGEAAPNNLSANQGLVQYNDPCGEIPDLSANCTGTLAFGGSFFSAGSSGRHEHQGMEWNTAGLGYVIVNNGVGACLSASQYRIMMTHELGHTLGFGHIPTSGGSANMNPTCCVNITNIDETCALFAYSDQPAGNPPGVVVLDAPADEAVDQPTTLELDWQALSAADSYHLQASTDAGFANLVYEDDHITQTRREVGPLQGGLLHYWRVRAENDFGVGPWSGAYRFTTVLLTPEVVTLRWPVDEAVDQPTTVEFVWREATHADRYQFQVSTTASFTDLALEDDDVNGTRREVSGLDTDMTYFWRVRGLNAVGQGPWSEAWQLTTWPPPPAAVRLETPADAAPDLPATLDLTWRPDPLAEAYHLQVSTTDGFAALVYEEEALTQAAATVGPLDDDATYFWRVRGVNAAGPGPWSDAWRFTTALLPPGAVALAGPDDEAVDLPAAVALAWAADPRADTYHLHVSLTDGFTDLVVERTDLAEATAEAEGLAAQTLHFWRVRGVNAAGPGPWSDAWRFTTALFVPGTVTLAGPDDDALDLPGIVTLEWHADPSADAYHLQVGTTDDFAALAFEDDDLAQPTAEVGPLAYSTLHFWRVRGVNAAGPGPWSDVRRFTLAVGTAVERADGEVPDAYRLYPNYPNPFNPSTALRFDLPAASEVTLAVYDVLGRVVETLVTGTLPAGRYTFAWEADRRPSGIYLARLQAGSFSQTRQMLLLK